MVSKGEIFSLAIRRNWGPNKLKLLDELLRKLPLVDINHDYIIRRYAEIDAYSSGRSSVKPLPQGQTARQMGKNDLWIAATASVSRATLLTTDHDFDHLDPVFVEVIYIDAKLTGSDV